MKLMVVSKEEISSVVKSFRTAEAIFNLENIKQHLGAGRPAYGYNSFFGFNLYFLITYFQFPSCLILVRDFRS